MGPEAAPMPEGQYGKRRESKHPDYGGAEVIGAEVYQVATMILRDVGGDTKSRKINSRWAAEEACGSLTGIDGEEWKSVPAQGRFLAPEEVVVPHVPISPF